MATISASDLRITDMKLSSITDAPMDCTLIKIETNHGITGYGEIRDFASPKYALQLKRLILQENPCNIDKIFRKIKQFGYHARQGGGVSGIEVALWDIVGKFYKIPIHQMLGGKFRDKILIYSDTDVHDKNDINELIEALKRRISLGFQWLKMDLGIEMLLDHKDTLMMPKSSLDTFKGFSQETLSFGFDNQQREDLLNIPHPFSGIHITEKGIDILEERVAKVREAIGYEIPLAIDHIGHISHLDCIKLLKRLEKYNLAWAEDLVPWFYTEQWKKIAEATTVPLCTGEDMYLKESFLPLLESGAISVIHPDVLTCGGILECKKIADLAASHGVAVALHMAETPVACLAAVHVAASIENFLALEYHSVDIPWWDSIINSSLSPLVRDGFIPVPNLPGLGIESLNDSVIQEHLDPRYPSLWKSTEEWDNDFSHDRIWS